MSLLSTLARRDFLKIGAGAAVGLAVPRPGAARTPTAGGRAGAAKSVILVNLTGGMSHIDSLDMKPDAPAEIRGEFKPIATAVPGIQICEHLPQTAKWMHKSAILRSVNHRAGCHNTLPSFTGSEQPVDVNELIPRDSYPPGMGAVCESLKPAGIDLPHYAALCRD